MAVASKPITATVHVYTDKGYSATYRGVTRDVSENGSFIAIQQSGTLTLIATSSIRKIVIEEE